MGEVTVTFRSHSPHPNKRLLHTGTFTVFLFHATIKPGSTVETR